MLTVSLSLSLEDVILIPVPSLKVREAHGFASGVDAFSQLNGTSNIWLSD